MQPLLEDAGKDEILQGCTRALLWGSWVNPRQPHRAMTEIPLNRQILPAQQILAAGKNGRG
jgi:hypothetical protein